MRSAPDLQFVVSGGSREGLGHLMRCAALAWEAHARGLRIGFALRGDARAREVLAAELPWAPVHAWRGPEDVAEGGRWVVFDTREEIGAELRAAAHAGSATLVLDDLRWLEQADRTVLPVAHGPGLRHPRLAQGAQFCVIPQVFRGLAVPAYPGLRDRALLSFGGADPLGLTRRAAEALAEALEESALPIAPVHVDVVLGPAFRQARSLAQRLGARGFRVHRALSRRCMCALMGRARFALCGFGTTVYELAYMGVPMLTLTHHAGDAADAARLEAAGIGASAGFGGGFEAAAFRADLARSVLDPDWCEAASTRGRRLLAGGAGAARILDLLGLPGDAGWSRAS